MRKKKLIKELNNGMNDGDIVLVVSVSENADVPAIIVNLDSVSDGAGNDINLCASVQIEKKDNIRVFVVNNSPSGCRFQDENDERFIKEAMENGFVFTTTEYEEFLNEQGAFFQGERPYPVVRSIHLDQSKVVEVDTKRQMIVDGGSVYQVTAMNLATVPTLHECVMNWELWEQVDDIESVFVYLNEDGDNNSALWYVMQSGGTFVADVAQYEVLGETHEEIIAKVIEHTDATNFKGTVTVKDIEGWYFKGDPTGHDSIATTHPDDRGVVRDDDPARDLAETLMALMEAEGGEASDDENVNVIWRQSNLVLEFYGYK